MIFKHVRILCFLLPSIVCQRTQLNSNLRGHSYGLENYLFQTYDEPEVNTIRNVPIKRVRPTLAYKSTTTTEFTSELENYPQQYESSRLKPTQSNFEIRKRRPTDFPLESNNRPNVQQGTHFALQEPTAQITQEPIIAGTLQGDWQEAKTEKIRKRIMLRRRRKRPQNSTPSNDNSEVAGNTIFKPAVVPLSSQPSTVIVSTRVPDFPSSVQTKPKTTVQAEQVTVFAETTTADKTTTVTLPSTTTEKPSAINLKTFLKQQTETLSLSELLQTQNLSLADLLRGNKDASAILKAQQSVSTTTSPPNVTLKRKTYNRVDQDITTREPPKMEVLEVTTSKPNYNRFHPKFPRIKPADQIISKPQYQSEISHENVEEVAKPTKRPNLFNPNYDPQSKLNELRLKLRNFQKKTSTTESIAPVTESQTTTTSTTTEEPLIKKNKISFHSTNNPELPLILPGKVKFVPEPQPDRLSLWNNRLPPNKRFGQDIFKLNNDFQPKPIRISLLNENIKTSEESEETEESEEPLTTTATIPLEHAKNSETKDELIDLLKSGQNASKLKKILTSRNMTLEELLDNREKHSLQQDISSLFTRQSQEPTTTLSPSVPPTFHLNENPSKIESYEEPYADESVSRIARVELVPNREPKQFHPNLENIETRAVSQVNLHPDDLLADSTSAQDSTLWKFSEKTLYYGGSYGYGDQVAGPQTTESKFVEVKPPSPPPLTDSDIILLETIRKNQDINRKFKLSLDDFVKEEDVPEPEDIEKSYIPPAVKSAIIASGVVMGIALFVFIAIFATCGWKQRQIRLKGSSSILGETLTKNTDKNKRPNTLSPTSFKSSKSYKKTCDFEDEGSESGSSNTGSYLWSTLKNTFTNRSSTLKSRFEREEKMREDKMTLRRNESRRKTDDRSVTTFRPDDDRFLSKKLDRDRNVINTSSFHFKRSSSSDFNDCLHGY